MQVEEPPYAFFHATVNSAGQEIAFWFEGREEDILKRLIGCAMIAIMPEEGVEEALLSLRDIWDFRTQTSYQMLPGPLQTQRSTGRVVRTSQRPELVIPE